MRTLAPAFLSVGLTLTLTLTLGTRALAPAFLRVGALAAWMPRALSPGEAARALGEPLKSSSRLTTCVLEPWAAAARFFLGVLAWGGVACLGLGLGGGVAVAVGWGWN